MMRKNPGMTGLVMQVWVEPVVEGGGLATARGPSAGLVQALERSRHAPAGRAPTASIGLRPLAQERTAQLDGQEPLANALRADEEQRRREPAPAQRFCEQGLHPLVPEHVSERHA